MNRIYAPLEEDHPLVTGQHRCWICERGFSQGERTTLIHTETPEQSGSLTVEAKPAHATCAYKGSKHMNPGGQIVIIERIKDGNGSPFQVVTCDARQWKFEEIGLDGA